MKKYEKPDMEVISFSEECIIITSDKTVGIDVPGGWEQIDEGEDF